MFKLLWIDMEMTGLDVEKEVIIELAALITNVKLEAIDSYQAVVYQEPKYLAAMDDWNQRAHRESGLYPLIASGKKLENVESDVLQLLDKHFEAKDRLILAGNSIGQDRLFINKYMPKLAARLHYRMLDVTSFKVVFNNFYQISYAKPQAKHRALGDIQESVNELKKYLSFLKLD